MAEIADQGEALPVDDSDSTRTFSNSDSTSVAGMASPKACCVCGTDLHGRTRYKDGTGRYWCPACNEKDQQSREPAVCPDCQGNFVRADLKEFKGTPVCDACWEKRRVAARREEARLRAVEEQVRADQEKVRRWKIIGLAAGLIIAIWAIAYAIFWALGTASSSH